MYYLRISSWALLGAQIGWAAFVETDIETLSAITIDEVYQPDNSICCRTYGSYLTGAEPTTGRVHDQSSLAQCGIAPASASTFNRTEALLTSDFHFVESSTLPTVLDLAQAQKTVVVLDALSELPTPEEAVARTVWGSNSPSIANFPQGWTLATLNTIWRKGWTDPPVCEASFPNSDDYAGQYTFTDEGFRYIALFADQSISIFSTPTHESWNPLNDANPQVPGWQSNTEKTDALSAPVCHQDAVTADAGGDQNAALGETICFNSRSSTAVQAIVSFGWDVDDDHAIDSTAEEVCIQCDAIKEGNLTLYVTDYCGCVGTARVKFSCEENHEHRARAEHPFVEESIHPGGLMPLPPPPPPPATPIPVPVAPAVAPPPVCVDAPAQPAAAAVKTSSGCSTANSPQAFLWLGAVILYLTARRKAIRGIIQW